MSQSINCPGTVFCGLTRAARWHRLPFSQDNCTCSRKIIGQHGKNLANTCHRATPGADITRGSVSKVTFYFITFVYYYGTKDQP